MANKQTRTRTPNLIPAMLEGGFSSKLENLIAAKNNELARQGLMTDAPEFVFLQQIRKELVQEGIASFNRVGVTPTETPAPAPRKRRQTKAKAKATTPQTEPTVQVREVDKNSDWEALVVEGSVSDDAPYGQDENGLALAPYGVKKNGVPKLRRGRKPAPATAEETAEAADTTETETEEAQASDTEETEEVTEETDEETPEIELDLAGVLGGEDADEEDTDEEEDLTEEDLDDLLNDLD